ncbi:MAG: isoprenylcysteine carboxylmethyltransferase family protein [SAR86 cluster bacterium]|jgi:protein-S-isoprenylcysteine O-methyltransferase Ste14|nr:isoprenylcysteine carboxylmethyltransferase family protein [SAR86 cluster bacterium]
MLKTKIPPPIIAIAFIVILYISSVWMDSYIFEGQLIFSLFIFILGLGCVLSASTQFRRINTTVNPLNPESASHLVVDGIFKFTRNPMYLGLCAVILAFGIYVGTWFVFILLPLFVVSINYLQIVPEEIALQKLFGDEYVSYCNSVRRWI